MYHWVPSPGVSSSLPVKLDPQADKASICSKSSLCGTCKLCESRSHLNSLSYSCAFGFRSSPTHALLKYKCETRRYTNSFTVIPHSHGQGARKRRLGTSKGQGKLVLISNYNDDCAECRGGRIFINVYVAHGSFGNNLALFEDISEVVQRSGRKNNCHIPVGLWLFIDPPYW